MRGEDDNRHDEKGKPTATWGPLHHKGCRAVYPTWYAGKVTTPHDMVWGVGLPKQDRQPSFVVRRDDEAARVNELIPASTMRRMMIVDDEQDICDLLDEFFSARGFSVSCAFSGEEALTQLAQLPVDVLLLDILLPGVSGIEVLKRVKRLCPRAKIVMVTALDRDELREEARYYGACAYITKPFDFSRSTWSSVLANPA